MQNLKALVDTTMSAQNIYISFPQMDVKLYEANFSDSLKDNPGKDKYSTRKSDYIL